MKTDTSKLYRYNPVLQRWEYFYAPEAVWEKSGWLEQDTEGSGERRLGETDAVIVPYDGPVTPVTAPRKRRRETTRR